MEAPPRMTDDFARGSTSSSDKMCPAAGSGTTLHAMGTGKHHKNRKSCSGPHKNFDLLIMVLLLTKNRCRLKAQ
jgi:hypothetical protein